MGMPSDIFLESVDSQQSSLLISISHYHTNKLLCHSFCYFMQSVFIYNFTNVKYQNSWTCKTIQPKIQRRGKRLVYIIVKYYYVCFFERILFLVIISVTVRKSVPGVKLGVINCQSISGKLDFLFDHIKEYQLDIVALTETWLSSEDSKNKHVIDQCVAHGYSLHHSPRTSGRRGGGLGLLVSNAIKVTFKRIHVSPLINSFELMEAVLTICSVSLRLILIPHAPSKINGLKTGTFYEEFSEYLEKLSCASGKVIILGDFNIIFLDTSGFAYKRFVDILETFDCVQHIDKPTHNSGHLLDYIITRKDSSGVSNLYVSDFISDHRALHVSLTCSRAHPERKQIEVRSLKRIQYDVLEADLIGVNIDM